MKKWTAEFTVEFTPVPPEMEEAYWEAIRYFARVMFADLPEEIGEKTPQLEDIERASIPEVDE